VLVVDDHYDTVDMLVQCLRAEGAMVLGVRGSKTAMGYAATTRFDAVLVDLRMPGEEGHWLLRELRASQMPTARAPVFALTGEQGHEPLRDEDSRGTSSSP